MSFKISSKINHLGTVRPNLNPLQGNKKIASSKVISSSASSFQQRLQVKKMMAARDAGGYAEGSMMERRLNQKIANLAANSYSTRADHLQTALQRQSDNNRGQDPNNYAQNLRDKIKSTRAAAPAQTQPLSPPSRHLLFQTNSKEQNK